MNSKLNRVIPLATAILMAFAVSACSKSDDKKSATQAAVRVNGAEITVHQVNQVLARLPGVSEDGVAKVRKEILDKLIDQQLEVEQATGSKLDRQPEVVAALEAARRDVLARAYLEQVVAAQAKPSQEEARKYFVGHPELFSQRRIYSVQELMVQAPADALPALREKAASVKSMDDLANWLKEQGIRFVAQAGTRPAEQIPMELLAAMSAAKDGQILVVAGNQGAAVTKIVSSKSAPLDESVALPRIEQFLAVQRNKEAVESDIKRLREKAKIEYLGDFAGEVPVASVKSTAVAPPTAQSGNTAAPAGDVAKAVGGLR